MKKTLLVKFLGLLVVLGGLASCVDSLNLNIDSLNKREENIVLNNEKSVLAKQAITSLEAMKLLDISLIENSINPGVKSFYSISTEEENTIDKLLSQFDLILENNNYFTSVIEDSDKIDYQTKETITFIDLDNKSTSYYLYYNDVLSKTKTEISDDEEEITTKTKYSGIAVFYENNIETTYQFSSENETSIEGKEKETKSKFKLFSKETSTYIEVEKENEIDNLETKDEYSYKLVQNGQVVYDYSVGIESNTITNKKEIELELNEKEYKITKYENNGETYFKVKLENENTKEETILIYKKVINDGSITYELQ